MTGQRRHAIRRELGRKSSSANRPEQGTLWHSHRSRASTHRLPAGLTPRESSQTAFYTPRGLGLSTRLPAPSLAHDRGTDRSDPSQHRRGATRGGPRLLRRRKGHSAPARVRARLRRVRRDLPTVVLAAVSGAYDRRLELGRHPGGDRHRRCSAPPFLSRLGAHGSSRSMLARPRTCPRAYES